MQCRQHTSETKWWCQNQLAARFHVAAESFRAPLAPLQFVGLAHSSQTWREAKDPVSSRASMAIVGPEIPALGQAGSAVSGLASCNDDYVVTMAADSIQDHSIKLEQPP